MFREYVEAGLALCEFDPGTKGPSGARAKDWNKRERAITDPQRVNGMLQGGLLHAYSATCSIDVDNLAEARTFLAAHGVDLDALLTARDAVMISSGRQNRAKLIYRLATPLPSKKLGRYETTDIITGEPKKFHALELRCATRAGLSVQDCLPPSIHPDTGKPYTWAYGNSLTGSWRNLPELPAALLALWQTGAEHDEPEVPEVAESATLAELRGYLEYHKDFDTYDTWLNVGMALHKATGGSPEGLVLWDEWSRKSSKYGEAKGGLPPQYPTDKWHSFHADADGPGLEYLKALAPPPLSAFPVAAEEFQQPQAGKLPGQPFAESDPNAGAVIYRALRHLVLAKSQGWYYDTAGRHYIKDDVKLDKIYTRKMPVIKSESGGGISKAYRPTPSKWLREAFWVPEVYGVAMNPGAPSYFEEDGLRFLNTWSELPESLEPTSYEMEAFHIMFDRPDEKVFRDWLMKFFAHAVQKPHVRINMAPLLVGYATGSGKNTLMEVLPRTLFGSRHFNTMTHATLKSDFSDKLADTWWLYFSELHSGSNKSERVSIIKKIEPWVTDKYIEVHPKGGAPYDIRNRVQPLASSNFEDDAIYVDDNDRRWCIGHIADPLAEKDAAEIYKFLDSERAPGVLHRIFKNVDLAGFNPKGRAPDTAAKSVMVSVNYGMWESKLLELMDNAVPPFDKDIVAATDVMPFMPPGMTAARLGRILGRPPFKATKLPSAYGKRLWCWRNQALWEQMGPAHRNEHHANGTRPEGHAWELGLPSAIAEACGDTPPSAAARALAGL
jgi:hypothetical protein